MLLTQDSGIIETINQDNDVNDGFNDMADVLFSCDFQNDAEEAEDADAVSVEEVCSNLLDGCHTYHMSSIKCLHSNKRSPLYKRPPSRPLYQISTPWKKCPLSSPSPSSIATLFLTFQF